jgi:hypothetical protein
MIKLMFVLQNHIYGLILKFTMNMLKVLGTDGKTPTFSETVEY